MRTKTLLLALTLATLTVSTADGREKKDIKTVVLTTTPQMHCTGCEQKIKKNIRFEKGVKDIKTDLDNKTVTITYDADKTNVENIIKGFKKISYDATEVKKEAPAKSDK